MALQTIEIWFMILSLWFVSGSPMNLLLYGEGGGQDVNPDVAGSLEPNIILAIYSISFLLILPRFGKVLYQVFNGNVLIWLIVILIIASTGWSDYPDITFRRGLIVVGAACFGTYFATCFPFQLQVRIMALVFMLSILMNLAFGLFLPSYGVMFMPPHVGAWRGIFIHKQILGSQMALMAAFFLILFKSEIWQNQKKLSLFVIFISIFLVFASKSSTGLIATVVLLASICICELRRFRFDILAVLLITSVLSIGGLLLYIIDNAAVLVGILGKDLTFSGRDQLWTSILGMVDRRPLFGYGYEAFWYIKGGSSLPDLVWNTIGWDAPHAHNGLLELLLALGWVGTSIFLVTLVINLWRSMQCIALNKSPTGYYPIIFLIYTILTNITEKNFFGSNLTWIFYVWMGFIPIVQSNPIELLSSIKTAIPQRTSVKLRSSV